MWCKLVILIHPCNMQQVVNELLQQAILICGWHPIGCKHCTVIQWPQHCRWLVTAMHTPLPHLPHFSYFQIRSPEAWVIFVSTPFILTLYSSCVGGLDWMRITLLILVFILFAAAKESHLTVQDQSFYLATEHQNSSVYALWFDEQLV